MQILVTRSSLARSHLVQLNRPQFVLLALSLFVVLMLVSGAAYHFFFLKAAREGWPVVSQVVKFVVRDEFAQRDRFMRENLDAMAQKVGEMQAKLVKLEAIGERVSGLAGVPPTEFRAILAPLATPEAASAPAGRGGPYVPLSSPSMQQLDGAVGAMEQRADQQIDLYTLIESRLLEARLATLMIPNSRPVDGPVGSGFGPREDPFVGRVALHTGLDFPAETGTPISAAAGGVVLTVERHPAYGLMLEIDHGQGLVTRYAHTSKILVAVGDVVRRGQVVAKVGTTGRSTGPHLHFEVLLDHVPQNPAKFLFRAAGTATARAAARGSAASALR